MGELEEARELLKMALDTYQKTLDPGHPNISTVTSNLAVVLKDLGELEEARELLARALESVKKKFKTGHPMVATIESNLAYVLRELGGYGGGRGINWKGGVGFLKKVWEWLKGW